jgi:hypothetical protein
MTAGTIIAATPAGHPAAVAGVPEEATMAPSKTRRRTTAKADAPNTDTPAEAKKPTKRASKKKE